MPRRKSDENLILYRLKVVTWNANQRTLTHNTTPVNNMNSTYSVVKCQKLDEKDYS